MIFSFHLHFRESTIFTKRQIKFIIQRYYFRLVLVRSSFGPRSSFVHPSFILRSSFVHPSFILRSGFVRDSFGIRRTIKEATKKQRRSNGNVSEAQLSQNEAKTKAKRSQKRSQNGAKTKRTPFAFQNDSFCLPKGLLLQSKTTPFRHQKDYIMN